MAGRKQSPLGFYTIGIAALFLAGFFLLVMFGAQNYRNTVAGQNENMKSRALLSYISTVVKAYDTKDAINVEDSEFGQMLVISDGDTGYTLRIYRFEDKLVEDYASRKVPPNPEKANVIGVTKRFDLERTSEDMLSVFTDSGSVRLHLRSEGGGV